MDIQSDEDLIESVHTLQQLWKEPSLFSDLNFFNNFTTNDSVFDIDWILSHVQNESQLAYTDLNNLRHEIAFLLHTNEEPHLGNQIRAKRAAPLAFAALASVGLFGSGILLGSSEGCGIRGVFGSCQDKAKDTPET